MAYQSATHCIPSSSDHPVDQWSCLHSNSIDSNIGINPLMLTPLSNYSAPIQEPENPMDHPMVPSLPNQFLKKLHCILTYEILPNYIYWNQATQYFTIRFETEFVHKYLPQLFQFFSISSFVKLLTNYGFKKSKKQKQSIQTYEFFHINFIPNNFEKIDSIIFDSPNLDPYGEFIENFLKQFNFVKLSEFQLKFEITSLTEVNNGLKGELEAMRRNINQLNMILYYLETYQFDKINLEDCMFTDHNQQRQSPQHPLIMDSANEHNTNHFEFGLIDALTMSETPEFIAPSSLKLPSGFPQSQIQNYPQNFSINNENLISFNPFNIS